MYTTKGILYNKDEINSFLLKYVYNAVESNLVIDSIFAKTGGGDNITINKAFNKVTIQHITLTNNVSRNKFLITSIVISIDTITEAIKIPISSIIGIVLPIQLKVSFISAFLMILNNIFNKKTNKNAE